MRQSPEAMPVGTAVAEPTRQNKRALKVKPRIVFVCKADGAVELDDLTCYTQASLAAAGLATAGQLAPLERGATCIQFPNGIRKHCSCSCGR